MDFFETPEEISHQLESARSKLKEFEERADSDVLMARLRAASPLHPALLARWAFLSLALLGLVAAVGIAGMTFVVDPRQIPEALPRIERSMGLPLPLVFGVFSLCLGVAYVGASQAALQIARDCPLLAPEQREHERLLNEVKRLSSQKAIMDRVRGTPMGARPRSMTPSGSSTRAVTPSAPPTRSGAMNSMPSYAAPTRSGAMNSMPSYIAQPTRPGSMNSQPAAPPPDPGRAAPPTRSGAMNSMPSGSPPPLTMPQSQLARKGGTPLGAVPRAGTPIGKLGAQKKDSAPSIPPDRVKTLSDDDGGFGGGAPSIADVPEYSEADAFPSAPLKPVPSALRRDASAPGAPSRGVVPAATDNRGFEQKYATHFPKWGMVDEPWLEDAIQKSEILATGFPVQARLQFSPEEALPFALVLERATPAMAVRAMVSYVEFLASISTPPKARIVLRSVPHLDRSFHRNVEAALEPYFADKTTVTRASDHIDILFKPFDPVWNDHPWLPIEQS